MPKGQPEAGNRRTDNTMVNRQRNKGQVKIYNILLKIEQHEPHEKPSVNSCASEEFIVPALLVS